MSLASRQNMWNGNLPYTKRVAYIESDGTQWIDTGINPTSELGADFKFNAIQLTDGSAYWSPVFGADDGWPNGNGFGIHIRANNVKFGSQIYDYSFSTNTDYIVNLQNKTVNINGQQIIQSSETFSATRSIYMFANNRKNELQTSVSRFYYCKLYQNDVLVRNLIPVIDLDGQAKMFDLVSGTYPTHYGTFIPGPKRIMNQGLALILPEIDEDNWKEAA